MKNENKDIQIMTVAEVGELVNDSVEGQHDADDANREQKELASKLLDHEFFENTTTDMECQDELDDFDIGE